MQPIELDLPWPPSVNQYWRHPSSGPLAGRHLISEQGRKYRGKVLNQLTVEGHQHKLADRLSVAILCYPPDRRRRDLDNVLKAALDALVFAGVMLDDSQIDRLAIERCAVQAPGRLEITIERLSDGIKKDA
jgi:crossover junction endodeoxyribonuclease RusA